MASVRTKIIGKDKVFQKLAKVAVEQSAGMRRAIALSALDVATDARRSIQRGGRSGAPYVRYQPRREGVASAPGEPPKTDTGRLVSSIFAEVLPSGLEAEVGTTIKYGKFLEFGTSKMGARPWLHPAFERQKPRIRKRLEQEFQKANQRAAKR